MSGDVNKGFEDDEALYSRNIKTPTNTDEFQNVDLVCPVSGSQTSCKSQSYEYPGNSLVSRKQLPVDKFPLNTSSLSQCSVSTEQDLPNPFEFLPDKESSTLLEKVMQGFCDYYAKMINLNLISVIIVTVLLFLIPVCCCFTLFWNGSSVEFDASITSFSIPSHESYIKNEVLIRCVSDSAENAMLLSSRKKRSFYRTKPLTERRFKVYVYYRSTKPEANMLSKVNLYTIQSFEKSIVNNNGFTQHCLKWMYFPTASVYTQNFERCSPPISLTGYFFPSSYYSGRTKGYIFDGYGSLENYNISLRIAESQDTFFWFLPTDYDVKKKYASYLKAELEYGGPLEGYSRWTDDQIPLQIQYFVSQQHIFDEYQEKGLEVLVYNPDLLEYQITERVYEDIYKTAISFVLIFLLVFMYTSGSILLTVCSLMIIPVSIVYTLFIYRYLIGFRIVGILNAASGIIVLGIGVDDIFVLINIFNQQKDLDYRSRISRTIYLSSKATFITSFSTSVAYVANVVSQVPAVRSFAVFMALLIMICWLMVLLTMPSILLLSHKLWNYIKAKIIKKSYKNYFDFSIPQLSAIYLKKICTCLLKLKYLCLVLSVIVIAFGFYGCCNISYNNSVLSLFSKDDPVQKLFNLMSESMHINFDCWACLPILQYELADKFKFYHSNNNISGLLNDETLFPKPKPLAVANSLVVVMIGLKSWSIEIDAITGMKSEIKNILYDPHFDPLAEQMQILRLCRICNEIAANTELVNNGRGQCLPNLDDVDMSSDQRNQYETFKNILKIFPDCRNIPNSDILRGISSAAVIGVGEGTNNLTYISFVFESTLPKLPNAWLAKEHSEKWSTMLTNIQKKHARDSGVYYMMHTSETWVKAYMEVIATSSAAYSTIIALAFCLMAISFFLGSIRLTIISMFTMLSVVCVIFGSFYYLQFNVGVVEVVSLSIIIGSSVDYTIHLIEAYIMSVHDNKFQSQKIVRSQTALKKSRLLFAVDQVGPAIIGSAITTICACSPLLFATLLPLRMFGSLIIVCAFISILFTFILCKSLMMLFAPPYYVRTLVSSMKSFAIMIVITASLSLALYFASIHFDFAKKLNT